ncbi:MAG: hypothetical protein JWR37_250, partial [Mycobacterium sp.]|nr:hypothetical protein [Mycobacterium sp.]
MAALLSQLQPGDAGAGFGGDRPGCRASAPVIGSQLSDWTRSRRLLAWVPISRSAGRWVSRLPIPKSVVSLIVVSVRNALPCLWYCLIRVCL